jgi:hypothetical protein
LLQGARLPPELFLLKPMPGIGDVLAVVIMLEAGNTERFADVGHFASYARCVDSAHYSNGKKKAKATPRMATPIWFGPLSKRPTLPGASAVMPNVFLIRKKPKPTTWSPPKHWPTNGPVRVITF